MRLKLPPYVQAFTDRHGKARYYFRKPGMPRCALPGLPWTPEFMAALESAVQGKPLARDVGAERTLPGTINALAVAYLNSGDFRGLADSTKATYRGVIDAYRVAHGEKRVRTLQSHHVARQVAEKSATPAAANNLLRIVRILMRFAVTHGWRHDDPTTGVRGPKMRSGGFYSWTDADIEKFEATHAIGTRARLAFDILLYTAQRRSDVVRIGRQHIKDGVLSLRQQKTGALVDIPLHTALSASIVAAAAGNMTLLVTEHGKPFSAAGFGNWFREQCDSAGLPKGCAAHGLRKAASRRLAEAGCTAHEIMSITGHKTLREVTRYTEAVDRKKLARTAMEKTGMATAVVKPATKV